MLGSGASLATTLSANHAGRLVEAAEAKPGHTLGHRTFIPEYTQELHLDLKGCVSNGSLGCPVHLTMGSATLLSNFQKVLACPGPTGTCHLLLPSLPWGRWIQVTAKSLGGARVSVAFSIVAALTGGLCREGRPGCLAPCT